MFHGEIIIDRISKNSSSRAHEHANYLVVYTKNEGELGLDSLEVHVQIRASGLLNCILTTLWIYHRSYWLLISALRG